MKNIIILGLNYKDCKNKLNSVNKTGCKYTLVTKGKHLNNIIIDELIITENAKNNPNYDEIMNILANRYDIHVDTGNLSDLADDDVPQYPLTEETKVEIGENEPLGDDNVFIGYENNEVLEDSNTFIGDDVGGKDETELMNAEEFEEYLDELITKEEDSGEIKKVLEEENTVDTKEEKIEEIKPVNTPRGWHRKNEFIDDIGNIFHQGVFVGNIND